MPGTTAASLMRCLYEVYGNSICVSLFFFCMKLAFSLQNQKLSSGESLRSRKLKAKNSARTFKYARALSGPSGHHVVSEPPDLKPRSIRAFFALDSVDRGQRRPCGPPHHQQRDIINHSRNRGSSEGVLRSGVLVLSFTERGTRF